MNRTATKFRTALSVAGIILSVLVGYNTWQQIEAVNAADAPHAAHGSTGSPVDGAS